METTTETAPVTPVAPPPAEVFAPKVQAKDVERSTDTFLVDPRLLTINLADNGRFEAPSQKRVKELADSLANDGQIQAIRVRKGPDSTLRVTVGFHRALAAIHGIETGLLSPDFKIRYELDAATLQDQDQYLTNVSENRQRAELTIMDKAAIYARLTAPVESGGFGMTSKDAAEKLGHKKSWGSAVSYILELPKSYQKLLHQGRVSAEMGYEVAKAGEKVYPVVDKLIEKSNGGVIQLGVWRDALRKFREKLAENGGEVDAASTSAAEEVLSPTTRQDGEIGDKKKAKKKAAADGEEGEAPAVKRTVAGAKKFLESYIEASEDKKSGGSKTAAKFLSFLGGKGSDSSMTKFLNSLAFTE